LHSCKLYIGYLNVFRLVI